MTTREMSHAGAISIPKKAGRVASDVDPLCIAARM